MDNNISPTPRIVYAEPEAIRDVYYDLKRTEYSDGIAGFSPAEIQAAADLLTQNTFTAEQVIEEFIPFEKQNPQFFVLKGTVHTYTKIVPAPLISKGDHVTAKTLPRLMVDLEEIITRRGVNGEHNCTEEKSHWSNGDRVTDTDTESIRVTCPGPLKMSITESVDAIMIGAETTFETSVEVKNLPRFVPY